MRRYETIYILRPSLNEEEINSLVERTNGIITALGGQIIELDKWGMKKLAYFIKKESQGFYIYCDYAGTPEAVSEMERKFRIDDAVLRFLTVKKAESITAEEISEAIALIAEKDTVTEESETADDTDASSSDEKVDSTKAEPTSNE